MGEALILKERNLVAIWGLLKQKVSLHDISILVVCTGAGHA